MKVDEKLRDREREGTIFNGDSIISEGAGAGGEIER